MYFSTSSALLSAACFVSMALATPSGASAQSLTARQSATDCPAGQQWFVCQKNNFKGCCSVDPCDLDSCPSSLPAPASSTCQAGSTANKLFQPQLFTILPYQRTASGHPGNTIHISRDGSGEVQQVIVFKDIPSTAHNCVLSWAQATVRKFTVGGNGLVSIVNLGSAPAEPVSADSVEPLIVQSPPSHADFTFWPDFAGAYTHTTGTNLATCGGEVAFKVNIDRSNGEQGLISLDQSPENGWYLSYDC